VRDGGDASQVALVEAGGTVAHRGVRVGDESDGQVEIVSGLGPGDRVIVAGGYALPDGVHVEPLP
jgi:multidrug efflux pump subunit AcrA (membrane-fusion protein)